MGDFEDALATAATTTELHFRYGKGEQLDGRIAQFGSLQELQLRDVPPDCVLPEELLALPALRELGLSGADDKLVVPALVPRLGITRLTVWDCHASALPPLPRLERLAIVVQDPASEVPILAERFSHLRELRIWGSHLEQGELPVDIERFSRLEALELISCGIRTLPDALAKLDSLRRFEIRGCPMDQFPEVLTRMPKLEAVHIGEPIAGLPPTLGNMKGLRKLGLGHALNKGAMLSRWDDIKTMKALPRVLGELPNLEQLDIDCCGVFDIEPLRTLTKLKSLSMSWSAVTTVEPLSALTELEELSIEHADRVKDLSPLARCKQLRSLNISNTKPKTLDFLRELPMLQKLNVESCESKRMEALYDLEVELEADDEVKAKYAARAELRAMPSIASIVESLGQRDLASVEAAFELLATWAAASSSREANALTTLAIKSYADEEDDDDDEDDDDEDDDDDDDWDDDDDEGDDDDGSMRALPVVDTALDRYMARLSSGVLARMFGVLFHGVGDNFPAALRIANELVSRGDDAAQVTLVEGFIAACEYHDAGHREHGYTVHDILLDDVFPLLGGPALAKLLAWAGPDHLDAEHGDGMSKLFAPAIARARGNDLAAVIACLEKYMVNAAEYRGGPEKVAAVWATFDASTQHTLAEMRARVDAHLAAQLARADREKRLEKPETAATALEELAALDDKDLKEYQGALWSTARSEHLPARSRRQLLAYWQRLDHDGGLAEAILTMSKYVPVDELRADLDVLAQTGAERGGIIRKAVMTGVEKEVAREALEKLRLLATELDGMPRALADSAEVRELLFGGAEHFEQEQFLRGLAGLQALPVYEPPPLGEDDDDRHSEFAAMVAHLAECGEYEPLQQLARQLGKLQLAGTPLERVLAQLVAVCMVSSDPEGLQAVLPLVPPQVSWDILAFNLACKYARESDREPTFKFTRRALELGKSPDQFLSDSDFDELSDDSEFLALLDAYR